MHLYRFVLSLACFLGSVTQVQAVGIESSGPCQLILRNLAGRDFLNQADRLRTRGRALHEHLAGINLELRLTRKNFDEEGAFLWDPYSLVQPIWIHQMAIDQLQKEFPGKTQEVFRPDFPWALNLSPQKSETLFHFFDPNTLLALDWTQLHLERMNDASSPDLYRFSSETPEGQQLMSDAELAFFQEVFRLNSLEQESQRFTFDFSLKKFHSKLPDLNTDEKYVLEWKFLVKPDGQKKIELVIKRRYSADRIVESIRRDLNL